MPATADRIVAEIVVHADQSAHTISRHIYGHFAEHLGSCIYGGIWVGEDSDIPNTRGIRNDVVKALRQLHVPNLRWPGGCFADEYHWRDGVGPRDKRAKRINTHWGGAVEDNGFGTHEFMDLCEMLKTDAYISANVGSGTVQEMAEWIEYLTFDGDSTLALERKANGREKPWKVPFLGVGNESWGCGGHMKPEYYVHEFRRYACFCRNFSGNKLFKIGVGPGDVTYHWTDVMMRDAGGALDGLSLHYYTTIRSDRGMATEFDEKKWFETMDICLAVDPFIVNSIAVMDKYDPAGKVALVLDEWGTWWNVEPGTNPGFLYQQNTLRDALVAGVSLNIFNNHAARLRVANIAQTVNVLQAMILTDGPRMLLTPTYHVFEMYKVHQDAALLPLQILAGQYSFDGKNLPAVSASASRDKNGTVHITLCNIDPNHPADVTCTIVGVGKTVDGRVLTSDAMNTHNTFDQPEQIQPTVFIGAKMNAEKLSVALPAKSVVLLTIKA